MGLTQRMMKAIFLSMQPDLVALPCVRYYGTEPTLSWNLVASDPEDTFNFFDRMLSVVAFSNQHPPGSMVSRSLIRRSSVLHSPLLCKYHSSMI
jgi:hypothetical protein